QDFCCPEITSAELYDKTTGTWTLTGSLTDARVLHTAALLLNGQVLVAGGWPNHTHTGGALASAELYDPATGIWTTTGSMNARSSMAGCWSSAVSQMVSPIARNSTTQPPGTGLSPAAPILPISVSTRRPCCPVGWSWWQGDTMVIYTFLPTRNCTIRPRELG